MSASGDIRVLPIPLALLAPMLEAARPCLARAASVARFDPGTLVADLARGHARFWCIFVGNGLMGCLFTSVVLEAGKRVLFVSGLGGAGMAQWAANLDAAMVDAGRDDECASVRFYGRRAWGRVLPGYHAIGAKGGATLFERVIR